ncbi:MAG: type III polyketide synthase [Planctomycetia bacterium]|nr:type III polyketide synthase [Planctomycetia bacterium]
MTLSILGIGTAVPQRQIAQADAATLAASVVAGMPDHERVVAAVYRQTRIRSRGSVLLEEPGSRAYKQTFFPPRAETGPGGPTTATRMERYAAEVGPLATAAATRAITAAGIPPARITHLVTCSCTGFANPGIDFGLVHHLGLAPTVSRTHVGFMGCHGAFNALRVADAFACAEPRNVTLVVCAELCSLHFQYGSRSDQIVANSIFADGAAALVGTAADHTPAGPERRWALSHQWSMVIPDSTADMSWIIGDHGFAMHLAATVPATIGRALPAIVDTAVAAAGLTRGAIRTWAVHPGGPRVLASVAEALDLPLEDLAVSGGVLGDHGNMSSATILFILERLLRDDALLPCLAMAFGPGLTAELALFVSR